MWIILASIGALFQSILGAINKRNLGIVRGGINVIALVNYFTAGMALFFLSFFETGLFIPEIRNDFYFWEGIFINVPLSIVAAIFGYKALRIGEYNYISPWLAFTSLFIIIPSAVFLKEVPSPLGMVGIVIVILGAIIMGYRKKRIDLTEDEEKRHQNNRKALGYLFIVGICFSISPIGMRIAVLESTGIFVAAIVHLAMALTFLVFVLVFDRKKFPIAFRELDLADRKVFILTALSAGIVMAIANGSVYVAIGMMQAPLVMAVKRIAPIFSFFIGYLLFKETIHAKRKLVATALMVIGTILITIFK